MSTQLSYRRFIASLWLAGCTGDVAEVAGSTPNAASYAGTASPVVAGSAGVATASAGTASAGAPGVGAAGGSASTAPATTLNLQGAPLYSRFVRLTKEQWANSVQDILALPAPSGLEPGFQDAVAGTTDFTNNEQVLQVDERGVADFQSAAEALATQVSGSSAALARIYAGNDPAAFIAILGRRAFRRPLMGAEVATYLTLFGQGSTSSAAPDQTAFARGAGLVVRALLQSPHFLYRVEHSASSTPLDTYEIAAKLSLWLRNTTPSDALLDAAGASAGLASADGVVGLATTMLEEPAARQALRNFHRELYHFDRYDTISKIGVADYDPGLNQEFLETSNLFVDKLFTQGGGVTELLTATTAFVGPRMAALYGVNPPTSGYVERELGAQRVGYFSQIPFLSLYGLNSEPDSIHRGVSMSLDVLCAQLGPPAANLPPIPALQPGQTNRQRISQLTEGCGGVCHREMINPLGFSFEHFDGMGRYRDTENGNLPVVSSGAFRFSEGTKLFVDAADLMRSMAAGRQAHTCYAKKLASFGLQRDVVATDLPLLEALTDASMHNGSIKRVILALVRSDAFRVRAGDVP